MDEFDFGQYINCEDSTSETILSSPRVATYGPSYYDKQSMIQVDHFHSQSFSLREGYAATLNRSISLCGQLYRSTNLESHVAFKREEIYGFWNMIFEKYQNTHLTVDSDRLVAISGIITAVRQSTGWDNIAGLWWPFIYRELLWKTSLIEKYVSPTGLNPTWSWISLNARAYYPTPMGNVDDAMPLARVEIDDALRKLNSIRIYSPVIKVKGLEGGYGGQFFLCLEGFPEDTQGPLFEPDRSRHSKRGPEYVIPLEKNAITTYGLGITSSELGSGTYKRMGWWKWEVDFDMEPFTSWLRSSEHQDCFILI
jgi:hypothetical protein